jgi:hypothetical protein
MTGGNALLVPATMVVGNAPDQRRTIPNIDTSSPLPAGTEEVSPQGAKPSVTIAVSAISINVGDKIIGTIIGPDSDGNRHFVAAQGIFSVDPQSALEGLSSATLMVTRTNRGIEALLTPDDFQAPLPSVPVKLQLLQANITQMTDVLNTDALVASDMPITLATEIGQALRSIGVVLPQGFSFTPQSLPTINTLEIDTLPTTSGIAFPVEEKTITTAVKLATTTMVVGAELKIVLPDTADTSAPQNSMSLMADMPDNKTNRAMLLQSPLLSHLLKSGRLTIITTPASNFAQPQMLTASDMAQLARQEQPTAPVTLLSVDDTPLDLPSGRLLLLVDTAPSKVPPLATRQSIDSLLPLTTQDTDTVRVLEKLFAHHDSALQHRANILPTFKADLPADILLLFNAFGRKLAAPALHKIVQGRYKDDLGPALPQTIPENVAQLISRSAAPAPIAESQQRLVLPLQVDGQLIPLVFVFSPPQDRPYEDAHQYQEPVWTEKEQIFALSIDFDQLGPLTLRGRCDTRCLNLKVETRAPLPEILENSTKALFFETLDAAGMIGSLHFGLMSDQGWQTASPAL